VWTLAVLVPAHVGKDTFIPSDVLGRVESLAYFFANCDLTLSMGWVILSEGGFSVAIVGGPSRLVMGGLSRKEYEGF
jgi:hypothetical protein